MIRVVQTIRFLASVGSALASCSTLGASIETLVMPGDVVQAHQEFEAQCDVCHVRFDRDSQRSLCMDCHDEIAQDIQSGSGFHGLHSGAKAQECSACHAEHLGREADIVGLAPELFDHSVTGFPLDGAHGGGTCGSCHTGEQKFREASSSCVTCHVEDDAHREGLGSECGSCHGVTTWLDVRFDHGAQTSFLLDGAHAQAACASCHVDQQYDLAASTCVACHAVSDEHGGSRGNQCETCHTPADWASTDFDHELKTGHALIGAHESLACASCHLAEMAVPEPPTSCVGCHGADDPHLGSNGDACHSCHQQDSWRVAFDHKAATGFALVGAHEPLECTQCHAGALTDPVATACEGCHVADDPHGGEMASCETCHNQSSWHDNVRFHHDLTAFPLLGGHRIASCEQCHDGLEFSAVGGIACIDCHRSDDVHQSALGANCAGCHSPVAWELWEFDHETQTAYPLSGAHGDLVCAACHTPGRVRQPPTSCVGCHDQDDVHGGSFGPRCSRCHTTETFFEPAMGRPG